MGKIAIQIPPKIAVVIVWENDNLEVESADSDTEFDKSNNSVVHPIQYVDSPVQTEKAVENSLDYNIITVLQVIYYMS